MSDYKRSFEQVDVVIEKRPATADHHGEYWLWDRVRCMNLSMGANSEMDAMADALGYYQQRLVSVESAYNDMRKKVDAFIYQFRDEE